MDAGQFGVDFEGFLELQASSGVVALPCLFMGHHLMHLRRFRGDQRQAQHGFPGKVGIDAIGGVKHRGVGRVGLAHGVHHRAGLIKFLRGRIQLNQLHANLHLQFWLVHGSKRCFQVGASVGGVTGALLRHTQQGLNFGQVRLHFQGRAQMGLSLDIVALKEEQNPEVGLSIQVSRFEGDQRLEFRNGEVGTPLVQVLLGEPGMFRNLVSIASRRLG